MAQKSAEAAVMASRKSRKTPPSSHTKIAATFCGEIIKKLFAFTNKYFLGNLPPLLSAEINALSESRE